MSEFRFKIGDHIICNLGPSGWQPGRIIALNYREDHWPAGTLAPYQVALETDHTLIYVPEDDGRYCRKASPEDLRIARRADALAMPREGRDETETQTDPVDTQRVTEPPGCVDGTSKPGDPDYRSGACHCCNRCPRSWSAVELYSEHYRCAERNGVKVTQHKVDLGTARVGDPINQPAIEGLPGEGFMQCPTLVRLPPGLRFRDDGSLVGEVRFDPHRGASYPVEFVAVSTARWDQADVGIVRLEIRLTVEGNEAPDGFDANTFIRKQQRARAEAQGILRNLDKAWTKWERDKLTNRETCDQMIAGLRGLRGLLERHPRLDNGKWWAQLGGYHMNVHKLLENTLFECELYLGYALTFSDPEVRWIAEQNLAGCYHKRLLEAARFMWIDGLEQMMRGEWAAAAETLRLAAAKKDGWGWAVNFGDIWFTESAARLIHGVALAAGHQADANKGARWITQAERLLEKGVMRTAEAGYFGPEGHPWAAEIGAAITAYHRLNDGGADTTGWLKDFKLRTAYWCAQVLGGAPPFPPKPRPRLEDADALSRRLPGHHD
ncbi:MAG: hypothetical protein AAF711_05680 [Planctomycetota bacterium]